MNINLINASIIISLVGVLLLFAILHNSNIPSISAEEISEEHIGKTLSSEVEFSSLKKYNSSIIIYPKEHRLRLLLFTEKNISINEDSIISFTGDVKQDEYGLYVITDNIKVRKK